MRRWQLFLGWKAWAAIVNGEFLGKSCSSPYALPSSSYSSSFSLSLSLALPSCKTTITIPSYTITTNTTTFCNDVNSQSNAIVNSPVTSSFAEVVNILLRPPMNTNSDDEVNIAFAALAMLPFTVQRLSLACRRGFPHPRFSEICPTKLISLGNSCKLVSLDST